MSTATLRPDGDVATPWGGTATPHYSKIDEAVTQPTAGDGVYIQASDVDDLETEIFSMEASPADVGTVTAIAVWGYLTCLNISGGQNELTIYYRIGAGSWSSGQVISANAAILYNWDSVSWSGLSLSKSDADDLQIGVKSPTLGIVNWVRLDTLYAVITYTPAAAGWAEKKNKVAAANISKVNKIAIASISKIDKV